MELSDRAELIFCISCLCGIAMLFIGVALTVIGMMIDHECYQLEPNENYQSSICERYWKNDKN